MGNPILDRISFVLCILLGSSALASLLTLIAAIASKTNNNGGIMAVLSMPLLFPLLINLIKTSEICIIENEFYLVDNQIKFIFYYASTGIFMGLLGLTTGMIWAQYTWGTFWVNDPKLNGTAVTLLIYLAYFILRNSIENEDSKARVSAIYNIIAFVMMIVFIGVLPRMTDSLHPGNGGNPAFGNYDLDSNMRMVFYPAVIGWILIGSWIAQLRFRIKLLEIKKENI